MSQAFAFLAVLQASQAHSHHRALLFWFPCLEPLLVAAVRTQLTATLEPVQSSHLQVSLLLTFQLHLNGKTGW
jgi:hypothetical protein